MKTNKLSFKRCKQERGLGGVGHPHPNTTIKRDGKEVGTIYAPNWRTKDNLYRISLVILKSEEELRDPKGNPNCVWKSVTLKFKSESEPECRKFLEDNWTKITTDLKLYNRD